MFTVSASQDGEKCFVPGCSTEYDSNKAAEAELATRGNPTSIFLFLKDDIIRKQRLQNISRDAEDKPQAKRYVCSLHLKKTDYYTSKVCRGTERQVRSLKTGALPTVFDNSSYPFYMKDASVRNRTTTMSSSVARREGEWNHHGQETEAWPALDKFTNLPDLKEKMADDLLPGFMLSLDMDVMGEMQYLTFFTYEPQQDLMPAMDNILRIRDDGTFVMYKHGARIPKGRLRAIIHGLEDHFTMVSRSRIPSAFSKISGAKLTQLKRSLHEQRTWRLRVLLISMSAVLFICCSIRFIFLPLRLKCLRVAALQLTAFAFFFKLPRSFCLIIIIILIKCQDCCVFIVTRAFFIILNLDKYFKCFFLCMQIYVCIGDVLVQFTCFWNIFKIIHLLRVQLWPRKQMFRRFTSETM